MLKISQMRFSSVVGVRAEAGRKQAAKNASQRTIHLKMFIGKP